MKFFTKQLGCHADNLNKFLLVMRLLIVLMISGMMQVSAAGYGQQITLKQKGISLKEIFREIKAQSGYDVLWQNSQLNADRKLNVDFKDATVDQVMSTCLSDERLSYTLDEHSIIVRRNSLKLSLIGARQDSVLYSGRVTDESNKPMAGATVRVKYNTRGFLTNKDGEFRLFAPAGESVLQISYVGYGIKEIGLKANSPRRLLIQLLPATGTLSEVQVVSNGYQDLAKERATGSFEVVTAKQLEHSTDPNLLKRLEGITTSMNFNNNTPLKTTVSGTSQNIAFRSRSPLADLTIRGKNTLSTNATYFQNSGFPLLVIDGIASAYGIDQLNPQDVESVTILKDAAAASIWGSRAANGVIVVKTKRGKYQQPVSVSLVTNFSISEKPDLFYKPKISVSDFIDAQKIRFINKNIHISDPNIREAQNVESPVDEIMNNYLNKGIINEEEANAELDILRKNDIRHDVTKYLLRKPFIQNYSLGISGGSKSMAYRISAGYDKSEGNTIRSGDNRTVLNYNASLKPFSKLELSWNATYILQNKDYQGPRTLVSSDYTQFFPYQRLVNDDDQPMEAYKYRPAFIDLLKTTYGSKIQDMTYKPLDEINLGSLKSKVEGLNLGLNVTYRFNSSLSADIVYSFNRQYQHDEEVYSRNSYFMRELINRYTNPNNLSLGLPYGDLRTPTDITTTLNTLRGKLNYSHTWNNKHALNAIAGMDISQNYFYQVINTYFGYDSQKLTFNNNLDLINGYPWLYIVDGLDSDRLPYSASITDNKNRAISSFSNIAYTYNNRYTISGSIRKDGNSIFGGTQNKTGTPFYSTGLSWNIGNEPFYHIDWLSRLQLRATFGYNGNSNPGALSRPRITYNSSPAISGLPYGAVPIAGEATNLKLRPERTGVFNLGLDFMLKGSRLSGSLEYYVKNTKDLITQNLLDPTTGFSQLNYNTGDLHAYGTDITLNSQNLQIGKFGWNTNFLFSSNRVKVAKLYIPGGITAGAVIGGSGSNKFNVGYDLERLFAFPWAGLDPQTGSPRIRLNGQVLVISDGQEGIDNYNAFANAPTSTAKFMGSAVPLYFGSLRNSFNYGSLSISANILYKFKYFTRRPLPDLAYYTSLYGSGSDGGQPKLIGAEFVNRWKKPGDEAFTNVPSLTYPGNEFKDYVYAFSDINVIKADHIRLQEINISWGFKKPDWRMKNIRVYANVTNLGILWRANKFGIDPDINDLPNPKSYSLGLSANF